MILELDAGNTRIKWRVLEADSTVASEQGYVGTEAELADLEFAAASLSAIRMSSVRSEEANQLVSKWAVRTFNLSLQLAKVSRSCAGVTNQYKDVSRLGIDRWLAMVAAHNRCGGPCVIVDSGTALTVDVVNSDGVHDGGYIIPGIELMARTLETNTSIKLDPNRASPIPELGHSTDAAVRGGSLASLLALIEKVVSTVIKESPKSKLYLSGGDAELIQQHIVNIDAEIVATLVLDGLAFACPAGVT
ncbi:MAG TPA: type III pantothenate kinase [Porticoccaceae bacterium]|jgi:type III pantothenate kinase|nr:type III pantothenate kinase [Gammaproteobacteria bacterium]HIL61361.1 type III pantothenate kinase [Porticoccaceae bacterium]